MSADHRDDIYVELEAERLAQDRRWGEQNHRDGTGGARLERLAVDARETCEEEFQAGRGTWALILGEEVYEAMAESDPERLRAELLQVAAVAVAWVEAVDRRRAS